jgi:hypothetical protein
MNTMFPVNLTKTQKWKVSTFTLDLPFTYEDLLPELENENWVNPSVINNLGNDNWGGVRFKCMNPKPENKRLCQLKEFFGSEELKHKFVHWLYETDESMTWDWEWTPDEMCRHTHLHGEFTRDMPGFYNVIHTDFRKLVATGLVYWAKEDNPAVCSTFYDSFNKDNPVPIPTNFGHGWIHSNGNNTWHDGRNDTDQMRYSTLLGLTLNITPIR